jgi:hypothetical protein
VDPSFDIDLLPGVWSAVDEAIAADLTVELRRESPPGHALDGDAVEPIATRGHLKETVWWLPERQLWACVHLTGRTETDPQWPACEVVADWAAVVAYYAD